jgi:two-component system OmpR family sensor kinase
LNSSQKTILNIVFVYLFITISLTISIAYIYYDFAKNQATQNAQKQSDIIASQIIDELEILHFEADSNIDMIIYPSFQNIKSAIYDIDKSPIYSEFDTSKIDIDLQVQIVEHNIYFRYLVEPHYLGANYLFIKMNYYDSISSIKKQILSVILIVILILILSSFLIAKIVIKPLESNFKLLDRFIKDTTHELNTPISTILGNIEMLELDKIDEKNLKKINRIKIASQTISTIYDDLSFLLLNNKQASNDEEVDVKEVLKDIIEYFSLQSKLKKIDIRTYLGDKNSTIIIDKTKLQRLIDNLLSNAIKYSKINSKIIITLADKSLIIEDFGRGMSQENIKDIFTRYKRFDESVGGFGIGFSIIKSIIDEYDLKIDIKSELNHGTKVTIEWE